MTKRLPACALLGLVVLGCNGEDVDPGRSDPAGDAERHAVAADPLSGPAPATDDCDKTCQNRRREFRYVVYLGKQVYCYWDLKKAETGTDYDALAATLEGSITRATTLSQYYVLLRRWAAAFHDGHVNVVLTPNTEKLEKYTAPVRFEVLAPATDHEKIILSAVNDVGGLAVGDEVEAINGVPARDALTQAASTTSGSTERMRRFDAAWSLSRTQGAENGALPLILTIKPIAGGEPRIVNVPWNVEIEVKPGTTARPEENGSKFVAAQVLPTGLGYLKIDAFEGTQQDYLLGEAMDRLAQTRGIILDLRQNGGGAFTGNPILERLVTRTTIRNQASERMSDYLFSDSPQAFGLARDATGQFALWHDLTIAPLEGKHYGKPIVVLIGPACFSACDTFSTALKDNHLATFVGEPTGGGTGHPLICERPFSPLMFRYSTTRGQTPSGGPIEGVGTSPDVYLEPTAEDRARHRDTQLARAVEVLQGLLSPAGKGPGASVDLSGVASLDPPSLDWSPTPEDEPCARRVGAREQD
jgi:C-terminal processing protease CtpA/Prc